MKIKIIFAVIGIIIGIVLSCTPQKNDVKDRRWWKEAVVYQIYPRSFKDTDGDGIGDLKGITSKLDYIKSLGVDVVWLNPIFASPNDDNGYDISDYRDIMKEFGTMADFDNLLKEMHKRGIKLVLDLVVNHSSDENKWFKEARSSRNNPYRNFYHWWPAEKGIPAERFSFFDVNNDAWKYDSLTNAYYLHYFSVKQPDLNWENPTLRAEIYSMMKFWFDKGIDGFRMDVIPFISKDTTYPSLPTKYKGNFIAYYANGPYLHNYLKEMNEEVLSKYDIMAVGEGLGVTAETAPDFISPEHKELNMIYQYEGLDLGILDNGSPNPKGYSLIDFKRVYSKWDSVYAQNSWGTIFLGSHDSPRMISKWGNDSPEYRELSSKMLTTFLLTMRATPFYYFGDELGMTNIRFDKIEDYKDIAVRNGYEYIKAKGGDVKQFMENQKQLSRDNSRTPFQWDNSTNAGFTAGNPWLKVNPNFTTINVAAQENDPKSPLNYFRKLITLRKNELTLVYGTYTILDMNNPDIYSYVRELNSKKIMVLLNFKEHSSQINFTLNKTKLIICNYPKPPENLESLRPYEARIYELIE